MQEASPAVTLTQEFIAALKKVKDAHGAAEGDRRMSNDKDWRKPLPDPLPYVASVPQTGWHFFQVELGAAWDLARKGVIPTIPTGARNKQALPRVLAQCLTRDPND